MSGRLRAYAKPLGLGALGLVALAGSAFLAFSRPLHFDSAWTESTRAAFERATGYAIAIRGPIEVSVFPRPMLVAHDVDIGRARGQLALQAPTVRGLFSLTGLLAGRTEFDKLEFDGVSGSVDADALVDEFAAPPPSPAATGPADPGLALPATLAITASSLQIRSSHPGLSGFLTDLHLLVDGVRGGAGSVAGGATWHGERAELAGRIDSVAHLLAGQAATGSLKIKSDAASASAAGTVTMGHPGAFKGSVAISAGSLSSLLRMAGLPTGVLAGVGHFSFSGTAEPTPDGLAFEDAHLTVNEDSLEGSIALEVQEGRLNLLGTLAADELDISPFVATLPPARTAEGDWNTAPIPLDAADLHDTDLRLSVGRLRLDKFDANDVALSVLCRHGRMELALGEARTYGGLLKARLFTAAAPAQIKADVSWSQVDVGTLSSALPQLLGKASGTSSGFVSLEGAGANARSIVQSLGGKGQASWRQMQVPAFPALTALLQPAGGALPAPLRLDLATLDFAVAGGLLSIGKGAVSGANLHLDIGGQTFLPNGAFVFSASAPRADGNDPAARADEPLRRVAGIWGRSVHTVDDGSSSPWQPAAARPAEGLYP